MSKLPLKVLIADEFDTSSLSNFPKEKFIVNHITGISNDEIIFRHSDTDILVIRSTRSVDKTFINKMSLKCIATVSRGVDHIDIEYAKKRKIKIVHCIKANAVATAEHTIGLMIAAMRDFKNAFFISAKNFRDTSCRRNELRGKTLGIVGYGNVGKLVYKYAKVFGMNIIVNDIDKIVRKNNPHVKFVSLKKLFSTSDILTIHIPLIKKNYKFFNRERLFSINSDAVLINTSRGEIIDQNVLIDFLKKGKLRAAALDVLEDVINPSPEIFEIKNLIITNHIAGKTQESKSAMALEITHQISSSF